MPLILRTVEVKIPHNFGVQNQEITRYVHPTRLRPGDRPVALQDISDRQLADLAYTFPEEYRAPCLERGLTPAVPPEIDDETLPDLDESKPLPRMGRRPERAPVARVVEDEEEEAADESGEDDEIEDEEPDEDLATIPLDDAQNAFLTLNAVNAISFISQNKERSAFLGKCYQAEKARTGGPRKTVLGAFTAAGVGAED